MSILFSVLLPVFYLLLFSWMLGRLNYFKSSPFSTKGLTFAFLLKIFSGVFVFLIYTYYYPNRLEADTFRYFDDSHYMFNAIKDSPIDYLKMLTGIGCDSEYFNESYFNHMNNWFRPYDDGLFNDNRLIIRINALIRLISFGNYHVHSIIINFISFIGLLELSKFLFQFNFSKLKVYFVLFLIPSFVFWSSGILKETILMAAVGVLLNQSFHFFNKRKTLLRLFLMLISFSAMIILKVYILVCFLPIIFYIISNSILNHKQKLVLPVITTLLLFLLFPMLSNGMNPIQIIVDKQHNFIGLVESLNARSRIDIPYLDGSISELFYAIPQAIFNSALRPLPTDLNSAMIILPFLENLFLLVLIYILLTQKSKTILTSSQKELFAQMIFAILFLFVLIGMTTPVIGAIVRYKTPVLPFLFLIILSKINFEKFKKFQFFDQNIDNFRKTI